MMLIKQIALRWALDAAVFSLGWLVFA